MCNCEFFRVETDFIESREVRADRALSGETVKLPWCAHQQSPVTKSAAFSLGGANLLKCGGDLSKCQVDNRV